MAKRIKNSRRINRLKADTWGLRCELAKLAGGKTPTEVVKAHTEYFFTCNIVEREILLKIFAEEQDKETTEIAKYFAEKKNV
jgi:hypothetical protein